jgi:hypothetical protein
MARKAGLDYLNRNFGQRKVARAVEVLRAVGYGRSSDFYRCTFALSLRVPLFAAAGVLDYPLRTFIVVVALGRAARYGTIAAISSHYGHRFVVGLQHPWQHSGVARDRGHSGDCDHCGDSKKAARIELRQLMNG